jgi:hypothetical protein
VHLSCRECGQAFNQVPAVCDARRAREAARDSGRTALLWACPVCPDFTADPLGWLRFRLKVATEVDTIEWWYRENLLFVGGLAALGLVLLLPLAWQAWAALRWLESGKPHVLQPPEQPRQHQRRRHGHEKGEDQLPQP